MHNSTKTLETVIDTMHDSVEGYRKAAELATTPALRNLLQQRADRRQHTLDQLNQELVRHGGELITKGTASGALHRLWLDITTMFERGDEAAVSRVEEGEDYLADKIDTALKADLDPQCRAVLTAARVEVREGERLADQLERQYG